MGLLGLYTYFTMYGIESILARHFPDQRWRLATPSAGVQKDVYVAENDRCKLVIKFDANTRALHRLAEIGVTPPLLGMGAYEGRSYFIQTFVEGTYPYRGWFAQNIALVAQFIRRYHNDKQLAELLAPSPMQSYTDHIRHEVTMLHRAIAAASFDMFKTDRFSHDFGLFSEQAKQLEPVQLVPIHADPSPVNIIVAKDTITMIDWDDVMLSDPMRDIGLMLWWYLESCRWQAFCDRYGMALDQDRLFWWVAKRSVELALWLDTRHAGEQAHVFLDDFYRAVHHESNPKAVA